MDCFTQDQIPDGVGWMTLLVVKVLEFIGGFEVRSDVQDACFCESVSLVESEI